MTHSCRLHYEGPSRFLRALIEGFREAGVTLTSTCVTFPLTGGQAPAEPGHLTLQILCQGRAESIEAAVTRLCDRFDGLAVLEYADPPDPPNSHR